MYAYETLKSGMKSEEVRLLQRTLPAWAWDLPSSAKDIDGNYGPATRTAVTRYQREKGLTADGIAGKATCQELHIWVDVVPGIDVSHHQGVIDWEQVAAHGIKVVYIKATQGVSFRDPRFQENWEGAKAAGIIAYAYHFADGDGPAEDELANYLGALRGAGERVSSDIHRVLDVESGFALQGAEADAWLATWYTADRAASDVPFSPSWGSTIYTSPRVIEEKCINADALRWYRLWTPMYGEQKRSLRPWQAAAVWQHTDSGKVPGIEGPVDLNRASTQCLYAPLNYSR